MFDIRYQYALHTTSYEEQPLSDRTLSRFRARVLAYETEHDVDLIHECVVKMANFTGRKPDKIYANFIFTEDGHFLIQCTNKCKPIECTYDPGNDRSVAYFKTSDCQSCPYRDVCNPRYLKSKVRKEVSWKAVDRAKQLQYMNTEEFGKYARFRNGVEAIPSLLRRRYNVDKIPVLGKLRTRLHFGFKIAAPDFQKLLIHSNSLVNYALKNKIA